MLSVAVELRSVIVYVLLISVLDKSVDQVRCQGHGFDYGRNSNWSMLQFIVTLLHTLCHRTEATFSYTICTLLAFIASLINFKLN